MATIEIKSIKDLNLPEYPGLDPVERSVRQWGDLDQNNLVRRGAFLRLTKQELGHGNWLKFLEETKAEDPDNAVGERMAQNFMRIEKISREDPENYPTVSQCLPDINSQLKLYSKTVSPEIREEVVNDLKNEPDKKVTEKELLAKIERLEAERLAIQAKMFQDKTKLSNEIKDLEKRNKELQLENNFWTGDPIKMDSTRAMNHLLFGVSGFVKDLKVFHTYKTLFPENHRTYIETYSKELYRLLSQVYDGE